MKLHWPIIAKPISEKRVISVFVPPGSPWTQALYPDHAAVYSYNDISVPPEFLSRTPAYHNSPVPGSLVEPGEKKSVLRASPSLPSPGI